jgi:hypothetical protein
MTTVNTPLKLRQVVDWKAAISAGVAAGLMFLLLQMALHGLLLEGGGVWIVPRYVAAIVMGEGVLPPPASFDLVVVLVALLVHFTLSILYALILAFVIHRWGLLVGILGGALFGLALYAINFYTFSLLFPWFYAGRTWMDIVAHLLYGAVAGGVYELLERETFVPA